MVGTQSGHNFTISKTYLLCQENSLYFTTSKERIGLMDAFELFAPKYYKESDLPKELYSPITDGLWMGGTRDDDWIENGKDLVEFEENNQFESVVTLFSWAHPMPWGVEELRWGFPDSHIDLVDKSRLFRVVDWAYERWQAGDKVLIRCQAGLNRSGLVTALLLMKADYSVVEAIELIRKNRSPIALFNEHFVSYLVSLEPSR